MTDRTSQSYTLPDCIYLAEAADVDPTTADPAHVARAMCLLLAGTVRDLLTETDHDAPFDATGLELCLLHATGEVKATGFYWTAGGEYREFPGVEDTYHLNGWTCDLNDHNGEAWKPLCDLIGGDVNATRYRLDLTRAAAL
ncbi:hypothetical protein ACFXKW_20815 [Streptomyces sp. NPDC059193]|uniref:hypothetical protein n=1 Tax=Streptomyces sp. NPDC059193 TaxID=3346763 RepID=UPI0036CFA38E